MMQMAIAPTQAIKRVATINCRRMARTTTPMTTRGISRRGQKLPPGRHESLPGITATA